MNRRFGYRIFFLLLLSVPLLVAVKMKKELVYDKYSLPDDYEVGGDGRCFRWNDITRFLTQIEHFQGQYGRYAVLSNYKNKNGIPPKAYPIVVDEYGMEADTFGITRVQSIPLYDSLSDQSPVRYALDGFYVGVVADSLSWVKIEIPNHGVWKVPRCYVSYLDTLQMDKIIFIDRKNQNMATMEYRDSIWTILSMNPVSTGVDRPPYRRETPSGVFAVQGRSYKMFFYKDGTTQVEGFAPYATRFTRGAYIHGIPVNYPRQSFIEYSWRLGTRPCTHMCVRTATSHAKFIYHWAKEGETLVVVF